MVTTHFLLKKETNLTTLVQDQYIDDGLWLNGTSMLKATICLNASSYKIKKKTQLPPLCLQLPGSVKLPVVEDDPAEFLCSY